MKIFGISGLGADKRVFDYLTLDSELIPIDWIKPLKNESIENYSRRLIKEYELDEETEFGLLGLSFGGLIATEISKILKPKLTILISSAETHNELRSIFKFIAKTKIVELLPKQFLNPPKWIAHYMFGTNKKELLNNILDDTDLDFAKWAIIKLVNWENEEKLSNVLKIGGTKDKLIPPVDGETVLIGNGGHFMIVDKGEEISELINQKTKA